MNRQEISDKAIEILKTKSYENRTKENNLIIDEALSIYEETDELCKLADFLVFTL